MVRIPDNEEFSRDWDWFSVDEWTLRDRAGSCFARERTVELGTRRTADHSF